MKELLEYRGFLVDRLLAASHEFYDACAQVENPFAFMDGEWNLHQIAAHVRDIDRLVYGTRMRETLEKDNPQFKSFDPDIWMAGHYNKDEDFKKILGEFLESMESICAMLRNVPVEAWSRESSHETIGEGLTLQLWAERSLQHIEEHLLILKKA